LSLTLYDHSIIYKPEGVATDITKFVQTPINISLTGSGQTKSVKLRINADNGQFVTKPTSLNGDATPILDFFDILELQHYQQYHNMHI